jgi:hypothetical protein
MLARVLRSVLLIAGSLSLAALTGASSAGCAPAPIDDAGDTGSAVNAREVLGRIPANSWAHFATRVGKHVEDTNVEIWECFVAFDDDQKPYVIAAGRTSASTKPIVLVVVDLTDKSMDLATSFELTASARAEWLAALGKDLQELSADDAPPPPGATKAPSAGDVQTKGLADIADGAYDALTYVKEKIDALDKATTFKLDTCPKAVFWTAIKTAGAAAAGGVAFASCGSSVVTGGFTLAWCISSADDYVTMSNEIPAQVKNAYLQCTKKTAK